MPRSRYRFVGEDTPYFMTMTVNHWLPQQLLAPDASAGRLRRRPARCHPGSHQRRQRHDSPGLDPDAPARTVSRLSRAPLSVAEPLGGGSSTCRAVPVLLEGLDDCRFAPNGLIALTLLRKHYAAR